MKIFFGIPLRSKQTSVDWDVVCRRLKATLVSIKNNIITEGYTINIVICGHEKPDFLESNDFNDVTFLESDSEIPSSPDFYMKDKSFKKRLLAKHAAKVLDDEEQAYFMFLDADDLIHSLFVANIIRDFGSNNIDDIAFTRGYVYDSSNGNLGFCNGSRIKFYHSCGSCYISKITGQSAINYLNKLTNHTRFPLISEELGRKVEYSLFPGITYVVNHGSNDVNQRRGEEPIDRLLDRTSNDTDIHRPFLKFFGIDI